jgi:polar amino acid transport system substrate-binding protein
MKRMLFAAALLMAQALSPSQAQTPTPTQAPSRYMRLATLEWPPYTGLLLPQDGLSTRITSVLAKAAGYRLLSAAFPWSETVEKGEKDPSYDGYFPVYYSSQREKNCYLSQPIGSSFLGLATLKSAPINWIQLSELTAYRLGVVEGYANGAEFDAAVKDKSQPVEAVASDALNVRKLLDGKVRGIVIDRNVLAYTLMRMGGAPQVQISSRPIGLLPLHVCFKRTPAALAMRDAFDQALKSNDPVALETEYFQTFTSAARRP